MPTDGISDRHCAGWDMGACGCVHTRIAAAISLLAGAFFCSPALADCVAIWAQGVRDPVRADKRSERDKYKANERFVVCVRLEREGFVTIWDAPPKSEAWRLFPNEFSHRNDPKIRGVRLSPGTNHCFGGPGTFPLFFDAKHGVGPGRLSVVVTEVLDDQPTLEDYQIPGKKINRSVMAKRTERFGIGATCERTMFRYFNYIVANDGTGAPN